MVSCLALYVRVRRIVGLCQPEYFWRNAHGSGTSLCRGFCVDFIPVPDAGLCDSGYFSWPAEGRAAYVNPARVLDSVRNGPHREQG